MAHIRNIEEERKIKEKLRGLVDDSDLDDVAGLVVYNGLSIPDALEFYDQFQSYNPMYYQD